VFDVRCNIGQRVGTAVHEHALIPSNLIDERSRGRKSPNNDATPGQEWEELPEKLNLISELNTELATTLATRGVHLRAVASAAKRL
jgi:hypothetical protein